MVEGEVGHTEGRGVQRFSSGVGLPRSLWRQWGWGGHWEVARGPSCTDSSPGLAGAQGLAWREGCGEQGWYPPGGLHTQRGQWDAFSQVALREACRSCRRAAHLTVYGSGRFPGAHNQGGSLQRQSGVTAWAGVHMAPSGAHSRPIPTPYCLVLSRRAWTEGTPSSVLPVV